MTTIQERMQRHQARMERADQHMRVLREFFIADLRDDIADAQESLDEAVVRGEERTRRHYEDRLGELRAKLQECEAELRAA